MATQTAKPKIKRTQYLVAKKFQLKYVSQILVLMFLTAALCSYIVYYTSMMLLGEKLANVYPQGRLMAIVNTVNFRILASVILVSPLVALIGILLSHRIAGPIGRMENFLSGVAKGDLTGSLILREGDELIPLADGVNNLVGSLKSAVTLKKDQLNKISEETGKLKNIISSKPQDTASIKDSVNKLDNEIKLLGKQLDRYKL